ncbi:MAG: fibronectin type III domain-containing protein [Acidobacteria bacterium]|nr:fibronectin type III domain-containing protein [Acidobacteriota bacterium]
MLTKRGSDAREATSSSPASRFPAYIGHAAACLLGLALLLGAASAQAQPQSATLLGTALTLTFDKGGAGIVIVDTPPLVHGFTVDGLGSGSVHPSAVAMDNRTVTLELGMGAEPGQTVTVSYDPDMVPKNSDGPEGWHNPLRYTDGTLVEAFSGVPVTILAPKPATGLSVSFVSGRTVNLSWTLPAQPAGVSVTAVEVHSDMARPGSTRGPDFSSYGLARLAADATSQTWPVIHGGFTFYWRVRVVTNFGDVDTQVVSWTSDQELLQPATGLTASNVTKTTVDLAWTLPAQPAWVAQVAADEIWSEVQQQETDETWSTVVKLAADAVAHTVTGLSAGTDYSFRVALKDSSVISPSKPVSVTTLGATRTHGLTASFHDVPASHDGETEFSFELRFSENFPGRLRYKVLRDEALQATNGQVTGARRVTGGQNQRWTITVRPRSSDDVTVTLPATEDCAAAGAICTEAGRKLSNTTSATIAFESGDTGNSATGVAVSSVAVSSRPAAGDTYGIGEAIRVTVTFSEAVDVAGSPRLAIDMDPADWGKKWAAYESGGGTSALTFAHTVVEPNYSTQGIAVLADTLEANGGSIQSAATEADADLSHAGLDHDPAHKVDWRPPISVSVADASATEGVDATIDFQVSLSSAAAHLVSVNFATVQDGTATAGADYTPTYGGLVFYAGETSKSISVALVDDAHDEGAETFTLRLSNVTGGRLEDAEATGTIENKDLMPAALLARFGRATAEQVVEHIEERMAAPRRRGFRARFAGREFQPGSERDFALGFLSSFAPMGMGPAGAAPMGGGAMGGAIPMATGSHAVGPGALGARTADMGGAMSMMGQRPIGGAAPVTGYGPAAGAHGGGLFGSMAGGGDLFSNSEMELNRESRGGILSVWSRSSRSYFSGLDDALSLNGDVRTTMVGADYSRGALTVGLSVGRTLGLGGYRGTSGGQMSTSMTGFYPWVGYQVNDRVSVWGVTGYGTGSLNLTPDGASALETGVSMAMSAVGTRGELIGSRATGGFALAFKADALWVGAASDLLDGPAGRLNASEAGVTRVRTALEGSRGFTLAGGRLSLRPSVEVGLRRDAGDAETGAGMDVGGGLVFTDTVTGLSLDVRVRTLVVHQAEGFTERGMSLSFGWDPRPSSPLGLTARVAPSWGGQAQGGAEALWGNQMAYGMGSHQMYGSGDRVDAEVGYGLPVGARFVGTPRVGLSTSQYGRDYRVGYGLGVLERAQVNFELGVDAQRRESPMHGEASNGFLGRATLGW